MSLLFQLGDVVLAFCYNFIPVFFNDAPGTETVINMLHVEDTVMFSEAKQIEAFNDAMILVLHEFNLVIETILGVVQHPQIFDVNDGIMHVKGEIGIICFSPQFEGFLIIIVNMVQE